MKYSLILFLFWGLLSCEKVKDHYRISGVKIQVGHVSKGANDQCIVIGNASDTLYEELIAVQIEFVREYYATESSRRQGVMYSPKGWEGCTEKISKLNILAESITITDKLFGDTTITGVDKNNLTSYRCQEKYGCDCRSALSITSIDSLVTLFNSQHKTQTRVFISEKYDKTPFVFFVKKKDLESFNGKKIKMQLHMSNGQLIDAESNKIVL